MIYTCDCIHESMDTRLQFLRLLCIYVLPTFCAVAPGQEFSAEQTSPIFDKGPSVSARPRNRDDGDAGKSDPPSELLAEPIVVKTRNELITDIGEYTSRITEGIQNRITGEIRGPTFRDLFGASHSVCSVPDQFTPVFYEIKKYICCEGLFNRTSPSQICCDKQIVDQEDAFCCSNTIHLKSETNHTECCGDKMYDVTTHTCCRGTLYAMKDNSSCCGTVLYNLQVEICCYNLTVHNRTNGDRCCGTGLYHSHNETCCFGNVQPAHGRNNSHGQCCSEISYDVRCHMCHGEKRIPVPLFDVNTQICCDGQIKKRRYVLTECCGRRTLDASSLICVNQTIIMERTLHTHYANDTIPTLTTSAGINQTQKNNLTSVFDEDSTTPYKKPEVIIVSSVAVVAVTIGIAGVVGVLVTKRRTHKMSVTRQYEYVTSDDCFIPNNVAYDCMSINHSICSMMSRTTFKMKLSNFNDELDKYVACNSENVFDNRLMDSETQTFEPKDCNLLTIFGRPFDHSYIVDARNPTLQMPESEETLTLPMEALQHGSIETRCSTFWNVDEILHKFNIPRDETLASPAAEYMLTGHHGELPGYSVVVKPFLGRPCDLKVYKFRSDQGVDPTGTLMEVPPKGKENDDTNMFYEIKDKKVYIYTKTFSGFLCTTCKHSRNLTLTAFLYGSYKLIRTNQPEEACEVRLKLYIADALMQFKDYQQNMNRKEQTEERTRLAEPELELLNVLTPDDELVITLSCDGPNGAWISKLHPRSKKPICPETRVLKLKDIAEQCLDCPNMHCERNMPISVEWYMTNCPGISPEPTFQGCVDVICRAVSDVALDAARKDRAETEKNNTIIVDNLQRPGVPTFNTSDEFKLEALDSFIRELGSEKHLALARDIGRRKRIPANSIRDLLEVMKIDEVVEEIVGALEHLSMSNDIVKLRDMGLCPNYLLIKPMQREQTAVYEAAGGPMAAETQPLLSSSSNKVYNKNEQLARPSQSNELCRREVSHTLVNSENGPPGFLETGMVRAEIGASNLVQETANSSQAIVHEMPVQEEASNDDTLIMKTYREADENAND